MKKLIVTATIVPLTYFTAFVVAADVPWYHEALNVPAMHAKGITGKGVKVGVVDEGTHGIEVSSIIGSRKIGIAPDCEIVYRETRDMKSTLAGMWYCATNGCRVINMSFGFNIITASYEEQAKFDNEMRKIAAETGAILLCGNGNNPFNEIMECPAEVPELVAIGGINRDLTAAKLKRNWRMDFCAFGIDVPAEHNREGTKIKNVSGTSYATPMATAIVALLLQQEPKLTRDEVYDILKKNLKKLADSKTKDFGWGLLQACQVPKNYRRQKEIDREKAGRKPLESVKLTNPELKWNEAEKRYEITLPLGAKMKLTYESFPADATDPKVYWHCGNTSGMNPVGLDDVLEIKDHIVTDKVLGRTFTCDRTTYYAISSDFKRLAKVFVVVEKR